MQNKNHKIKQPPRLKNPEGQMRRVGVELEISGLELDALAGCDLPAFCRAIMAQASK